MFAKPLKYLGKTGIQISRLSTLMKKVVLHLVSVVLIYSAAPLEFALHAVAVCTQISPFLGP